MTWLLTALIVLPTASCSGDGQSSTASADLGGRPVTIAVENRYPPYNFVAAGDAEGQGWDYDVWREICKRLNCKPDFVEATWPEIIHETGQGAYDVAADGISITDAREEVVDFSDPYMVVEQKLMIRSDEDRFRTADEIIDGDYRIGTEIGTTNSDLGAALVGEERVTEYEEPTVTLQALITGDVDAIIFDDMAGHGYRGPDAADVELIDGALERSAFGFVFPPASPLIPPVNAVLRDMTADGTLDELIDRWFVASPG